MKIHTYIRDAKRMEINELQAINKRATKVMAQAKLENHAEPKIEEAEAPTKTRKKKKEENV